VLHQNKTFCQFHCHGAFGTHHHHLCAVLPSFFLLLLIYRKPPTISPGLIYFRKRFLMGLYKGGLIYGGGLIHGQSFVLVINKSDIKQVNHKQENKRVLSSDYWAYIN
jgi:hypothetical protein